MNRLASAPVSHPYYAHGAPNGQPVGAAQSDAIVYVAPPPPQAPPANHYEILAMSHRILQINNLETVGKLRDAIRCGNVSQRPVITYDTIGLWLGDNGLKFYNPSDHWPTFMFTSAKRYKLSKRLLEAAHTVLLHDNPRAAPVTAQALGDKIQNGLADLYESFEANTFRMPLR